MAKEKVATPVEDDSDCFGKFYDPKDGDCKSCNDCKKCAAAMAKSKTAKEVDDDDDDEEETPVKSKKATPPAKPAPKAAPAKNKKAVDEDEDDDDDDADGADDDDDEDEKPPVKTSKKTAPPSKVKPTKKAADDDDDDDDDEEPPVKSKKPAPPVKAAPPAKTKKVEEPEEDEEEDEDEEELDNLTNTIKKKARIIAKAVLAGKSLVTYADGKLEIKAFDAKKAFKASKKKTKSPEEIEFRDFCRTTLKDDEKMLKVCRALKLKWNEHDTPMVNRMRMTMALKEHYFKNEMTPDDVTKLLKSKK